MKTIGFAICGLIVFATLSTFMLSSCSRKPQFKTVYWNGTGPIPNYTTKFLPSQKPPLKVANEQVSFEVQEYDGAPIEGTFLKKINSEGQDRFLVANLIQKIPNKLKMQIAEMREKSPAVQENLQKNDARFKNYKYEGAATVVLRSNEQLLVPTWKVIYYDGHGQAWALYLNSDFSILKEESVGSQFQDATALVFPESPRKSEISSVLLKQLTGNGVLQSDYLTVLTESTMPAKGENNTFKFASTDERFDQVQAFYFISKALNWFEEHLEVKIPFPIKAIVHIGYPKKENAAFYYSGQIRLGAGDGITWARIPLDPSIVIHETSHAIIDALAHLPFQEEGGSINEAFADFFTCVQIKSPFLGEVAYKKSAYKRSVLSSLKVSDKNGGVYHDSAIVSGTLWSMKEKLGEEKSIRFAVKILSRLHPAADFTYLGRIFYDVAGQEFKSEELAIMTQILEERGWSK